MKFSLKSLVKQIWENYTVWQYVRAGLRFGDAMSYDFMGKCVGYDRMEAKLKYWEAQYAKLGYEPLSWGNWEDAGGYYRPYAHLLRAPASGQLTDFQI